MPIRFWCFRFPSDRLRRPRRRCSPLRLNPDRNVITPEELAETRVGETPAEANGWGILDHGVGSLEKVHVVNGRTVDVDMGHEAAYVYIAGRKYRLRSDVLTEED